MKRILVFNFLRQKKGIFINDDLFLATSWNNKLSRVDLSFKKNTK